jgi:hypothetical protein
MKAKKLLMPLALIFLALFLAVKPAKAQETKDLYLYVGSNNHTDQGWMITYHSNDTQEDYVFDTTTNWILAENLYNEGMTILGTVPVGSYTVTVEQLSYINGVMNDFYIGTGGPYYNIVQYYGDDYTFGTAVSVENGNEDSDLFISFDFEL